MTERNIRELLLNHHNARGDNSDRERLTRDEQQFLDACTSWRLGDPPLEKDARVLAFVNLNPENLAIVRDLQAQLLSRQVVAQIRNSGRRFDG